MPPKFRLPIPIRRRAQPAFAPEPLGLSQQTTDRIRALEAELAETFERIRRHL